jgi:hypothetical protein
MTVTAARDRVLYHLPRVYGRYVTATNPDLDTILTYRVVSRDPATSTVFAESPRTGLLVAVTRTGTKVTDGQVRVRIEYATDTGDAAGTLQFGPRRIRGRAPADLFPEETR